MRKMLKSRNLVKFAKKSKNLKIKNILKVALISGHTVELSCLLFQQILAFFNSWALPV